MEYQSSCHSVAVQLSNVTKNYQLYDNERQRIRYTLFGKKAKNVKSAVDNVSLIVHRGESVAFFGQNGAGKSTLLKMITGVTYPTKGHVRVNGSVSALLELTAGFDRELTGRGNIRFRGDLLGIPGDEIRRTEDEIIAFSELGVYADQPVRSYSSGMCSRLGFALNTSFRPDILIIDEALSVGDKKFRLKCLEKINEMLLCGTTLLFVTHSLTEAKQFCKRGVVIERGKLFCDSDVVEAAFFYDKVLGRR